MKISIEKVAVAAAFLNVLGSPLHATSEATATAVAVATSTAAAGAVACPTSAEVEGRILTHEQKVDLGRRVLTRCQAFSEPAQFMSLHGYFAWLLQRSAERFDAETIRDLRDGAQGAFKIAAPDWKKVKVAKTESGVYQGERAVRTYRFALGEALKMEDGRDGAAVTAPAPSVVTPVAPAPVPMSKPRLAPPPAPVFTEQAQDMLTAPYHWLLDLIHNPSSLLDYIPGVRR